MKLKNGYKVIYEKIADGTRAFYATKNIKCDPTVDDKIIEAEIGKYKLVYEKAGRVYGSESGIPAEGDFCFEGFDKVFIETEIGDESVVEPEDITETPVEDEEPTSGNGESMIEE